MTLNALIIDDEPDAHKLLDYYCHKSGMVTIIGNCFNSYEAIKLLEFTTPDFMFLDINMPEISGIQMLDMLKTAPRVIFTTAHTQFAVDGYEYNTVDYLLKPVKYERFLKAVAKVSQFINPNYEELPKTLLFQGYTPSLRPASIMYIEALGNYMRLHTKHSGAILVHETMKVIEEKLKPFGFIRCHKGYICNIKNITSLENDTYLLIGKIKIPVGISYRQQIKNILKS